MSQELERVYTINLGKVLLSPDNQRAKRAVNMVKEYARHHMKTEEIKIEESVNHQIWKRGIKHPPRKIRVRMTKTDEGFVLVSPYEKEIEEAVEPTKEKKMPEVEEKPESETKQIESSTEEKEEPTPKAKEPTPKAKEPTPKAKEQKPKAKEPTKKAKSKDSKKAASKKDKPKKKSK
ncbi:MAG TPA: 50S ribosomal protein L31e [Nitrosopumilaceae archaeon]|nr:50S ribosomal protein L31e [Nitrosopumilaceae archaeon]